MLMIRKRKPLRSDYSWCKVIEPMIRKTLFAVSTKCQQYDKTGRTEIDKYISHPLEYKF